MIIGLTGKLGSGKDSVLEYLVKEKGFGAFGTGDVVREYVKEFNWPDTRDSQREMANMLSNKYGVDFLLKETIKRAEGENKVISGIRQPAEADYFNKEENAYLIAVDAPIEVRFSRMQTRARTGDPQTLEELKEKEAEEMGRSEKNVQNISYCIDRADFELDNSGSKEELYKQVEKVLEEIYAKIK
jgi:dephospho-CoA kinase